MGIYKITSKLMLVSSRDAVKTVKSKTKTKTKTSKSQPKTKTKTLKV